jgi:hypothetical protein
MEVLSAVGLAVSVWVHWEPKQVAVPLPLLPSSDFSSMSPRFLGSIRVQHLVPLQQEVPMAAGPRILCIGNHLEVAAKELRAVGFDVMMAANAQSARALIHLYPPAAIVAHQDDGREIHQKHPQIPTVLLPANVGGKLPPQSASNKAGHREASSF